MYKENQVCIFIGEELGLYSFGKGHPFGLKRMGVFWDEVVRQGLDKKLSICKPVIAHQTEIEIFHTHEYVERVKAQSLSGKGFLDYGDTPAFKGVYEAAAFTTGTCLDALNRIISGECKRVFIPIAGFHHARRDSAGGFCTFNDCGILIETLRDKYKIKSIAYIDIDAHHGDGVYYSFEDDPDVYIADIHEDGRFLYPGTGAIEETGTGNARGTKLNIPLPPYADDKVFFQIWPQIEEFIDKARPEIILFQCGADGLSDDPITHLRYSESVHTNVALSLTKLADRHCSGRILAMGGGGYNLNNIAKAWTAIISAFLEENNSLSS